MKDTYISCDTLVAGGGIAGIAAALASARQGADTLLIEKECLLGGLGTLGLVTIYLPLCDGCGNQVISGIAEELLRLSIRHGCEGRYPAAWLEGGSAEEKRKKRFDVQYNPHLFAIDAESLLLEEGARLLYDTRITDVRAENGFIREIYAYNKGGRVVIRPKMVVDATGDADICRMSGAPTAVHEQGNPLSAWYYYAGESGIQLNMLGPADIPGQISVPLVHRRFSGLDGQENTDFIISSHRQLLKDVLRRRESDPSVNPATIPAIPQLRMTCRLDGAAVPDEKAGVFEAESIGTTGDWRKCGPVFELPFGCLHNAPKMHNLLAAGRCISVTDALWDITRVIPVCALTGQAAGTAAALSVSLSSPDLRLLSVVSLQHTLSSAGVRLHL